MSEAARDGWGRAVALLLGDHEARLRGEVLDAGGGAAPFARTMRAARLTSAEALVGAPGIFDAALSISRLQFAQDPPAEVAAMARACRPGGAVLLVVPHAFDEELVEALNAFTLRGLRALAVCAGLEVAFTCSANPPGGGVLRREAEAFTLQSPRRIVVPDEMQGWVDRMDAQRPMLLACLGVKAD